MYLCVSLWLDFFLSSTDLTCVILQPLSTFLHIQSCFLRSQQEPNKALLITFLFCLVTGFLSHGENAIYCLTSDPLKCVGVCVVPSHLNLGPYKTKTYVPPSPMDDLKIQISLFSGIFGAYTCYVLSLNLLFLSFLLMAYVLKICSNINFVPLSKYCGYTLPHLEWI